MSPKKTVQKPNLKRKNAEKPTPKQTIRKRTLKSNQPVNFKVSIPLAETTDDGVFVPVVKGRRPPQFKKNLDVNTKVELANSVARQQLAKNDVTHPVFEPDNVVYIQAPKIRRRTFKNKVISDFFEKRIVLEKKSEETVTSTATKTPVKDAPKVSERPRRIVTRKRLADSTAQLDAKQPREDTDTEMAPLNVNIKVENIQAPEEEVETNTHFDIQPADEEPLTSEGKTGPVAHNKKCPIKRPRPASKKPPATKRSVGRKKQTPQGKQETVTVDSNPSIVDQLRKPKKPNVEIKIGPKPDTSARVNSNRSSVSSNSNWSCTTTCVTVSPTDFVHLNKKVPVLVLTNIDNEVKKRQIDAQKNTVSNDVREVEESSDSTDSESQSSDSEDSDDMSEQELINRNSLDLSDSPEFVKAIDKLIALIKKLDMEMINWINSHNGAVNVNFVKRNDEGLNFLNDELEMISVCQDMDSVINSAKVDDESRVVETVSDKENNTTDNNEIVTQDTNTVTNKDNDAPVKEITQEEQPEPEFVKPQPVRRLSSSSKVSNTSPRASRDDDSSDDEPADGGGNSYYDHHDDDDALSLFAESISGFESIRPSVVSAPVSRPVEEYVPRPVNKNIVLNIEKPVYCPTKIRETSETVTSKTICEKQNADSTSIYKQSNSTDGAESDQDFAENIDLDTRPVAPDMIRTPRLMESFFEGMPKARSVVFGNVCFYNLLNACRKVFYGQCMFMHMIPSCEQIKAKLTLLDEMMLIKEYLLVRNWVELRRRYGMCFVEECARRGLTRILVEMAYDFIVKARCDSEEDTRLRVNTIEITLLHLNNVDLSICDDLLKLVVATDKTNRTLLCDVFMATMSITQNFSRFKIVFLNLIHFMVNNDRTFNKDVVEHILERVCILAFEESVARALIQMMRLTNADIFNNSMIRLFEKQISVNKDVYEEYTLLKNRCAFTAMLASSVVESPSLLEDLALSGQSDRGDDMSAHSDRGDGQVSALDKSDDQRATGVERGVEQCAARSDLGDGPPSVQSDNSDGQPPAPSPDTTNLDKLNKSLDEPAAPIITRTIGMNPPIVFSRVPTSSGTSQVHEASDPTHESPSRSHMFTSDDTVAVNYGTWRNRSIFPRLPLPRIDQPVMRAPSWTPMRPRMRLPFRRPFNQRLVTFRTPSNIVRRPGPKY